MLGRFRFCGIAITWISLLAGPAVAIDFDENFSGVGPFSILNPTSSPPQAEGDYNDDNFTNAVDYAVWRESLGDTGPDLPANGDDGSGAGTPDEMVDGSDYAYWRDNYGARSEVVGFEEDNWQFSGITANQIGSFSSPSGTFDVPKDQDVGFVLNPGGFDIYQSQSGLLQPALPIGGRIEYEVQYENIQQATLPTDPNAMNGVTSYVQLVVTQMNFGNVNQNGGPANLEFMDMQINYDSAADTYSLNVVPLVDGVPSGNNIIPDLEGAGLLGAEEELTAFDLRVTIDSDTVNGGSTILVEFQINNSGVYEDFYNLSFGIPIGEGINGIDYPVDLAADGTTVLVNNLALSQIFVDPSQPGAPSNPGTNEPHPFLVSNGLSLDRVTYNSPDVPEAGGFSSTPEPGSLALLLLGSLVGLVGRRR